MVFRRKPRRVLKFAARHDKIDALISAVVPFELRGDARRHLTKVGATPIKLNKLWSMVVEHHGRVGPLVTFVVDATKMSEPVCASYLTAAEPHADFLVDRSGF